MKININIPNLKKLPQGKKLVKIGETKPGDLIWTPETNNWEQINEADQDCFRLITSFKAVAR